MISPLFKKKALDAMLDELAETALGDGSRAPLIDQRKKSPSRLPGEYNPPEEKGTEFSTNNPIVIPAKDLAQAPDPADAEFFKESDPAPEFEMSASGVRRITAKGTSAEWEYIQTILLSHGYKWFGRVSDGTEMWGKLGRSFIYDPRTQTWILRVGTATELEGNLDDIESKITAYDTPKTSSLKSCIACECGGCIAHDKFAAEKYSKEEVDFESPAGGMDNCRDCKFYNGKDACSKVQGLIKPGDWCNKFETAPKKKASKPWCSGCSHPKAECTCEGCECPENKNKKAGDLVSYGMGQPLGGTDNPTGGDDDENADQDQNVGFGGMDMTSSLDEFSFTAALRKVATMKSVSWWAKSARPTEEKIKLLQKQLNLTPELIELCIDADPSPQQKDFVATIAKWFAKKLIALPEDTAKLKEQLGLFQKLKKSPKFKGNKDIQGYDPAGLFKTVEENQQNISEKEKKRRVVKEGATLIIDEGDLTIYKVTDADALMELSGGTNWCTAHKSHGTRYLGMGPTYVMFKGDSAFAQLHPSSDQFMDRQDVCMVSDLEDSMGERIAKIVEDPTAMRGLQLLSAKEPEVAAWVKENATEPGTVEQILGRKRDEEQAQGDQSREMTVRHAIQVNQPLPPDQEANLPNQKVDVDLLYKYGKKFHAGQPWQPLEQAVFQDPDAGYIVSYIEEFRGGQRWPAGERKILDIAFSNQNKNYNEDGMNQALLYAERIIKGRWPEMETYFHNAPATPANGKGSAEYALRILQHRWPQVPGNDPAAPIHEENIIHANPKWMNEYSKKFMPEQLWDRFRDVLLDRTGIDENGYNAEQDFWVVREYSDLDDFVSSGGDRHAMDAMEYALDSEAEGPNGGDLPDMDDMAAEIAKNLSYTAMKRIAQSLQSEQPDLVQRWQQANSLTEFDYTSKVQMESILVYAGRYAPECSVWQNIRQAFEEGAQAHYKSRRIGDLEYALDSDMYERGEDGHGRPIFTELLYGPDYKSRFGGNWRIAPVTEVLTREGASRMLQDYGNNEREDLDISRGQLDVYMMEPDDSDSDNNEESFELMDRWYTKGTPQKKDPNQMQLQFQSSLLKKKALVNMHETPTMLPPRTDIRRHIDQQEQDAINADVREGLHDATPNTMKPSIGQIDPRINPHGVAASKHADYDQQQDEADEYFLDQVQDAKNEAKRYFMEEDYIKQLCDDYFPPKTMEEMWDMMGEEWTAEFYGTPYKRVQDFTDQPTPQEGGMEGHVGSCPSCKTASLKTLTDEAKGYKSSTILAECQNCRGFYSLPSNK